MAKWLVAVNRSAGRRAVDPGAVRSLIAGLGVDASFVAPSDVGEMKAALVEAAGQGFLHFALVGGDGTINLAANVLIPLGLGNTLVLASLPVGTGCDLLKTFGLPQDLEGAARHLLTDDTYVIDVATLEGDWGSRYFLNVAQAGAGAAAAETAPKISRRLGPVRYPIAFGARLPRFPKAQIRLTTEKRVIESSALAVIMANAQFFAGGWNVAPKAVMSDGLLDMQVIDAKKTEAPALVPKVVKGTHLSSPVVRRFSASEFELETKPSWPIEADGDLIGRTTVRGRVLPGALRLKI